MKYQDIVVVKRWIPILEEYERTRAKVTPRPFKFVKNLCEAHHIKKKELGRYYRKWKEEVTGSGFGYLIIYLSSPLVIYLVSYSVINSGLAKAQFPKAFK